MAYEIRAHRDGYRRGGMAHSTTPTVHPAGAFSPEQLASLQADPRIMIREVDASEAPTEVDLSETPKASKPAAKKSS